MKWLRFFFGPEALWLLACLLGGILVRAQKNQPGRYDSLIENSTFWPAAILALTMCLYMIPAVPRQFLFLRIVLTALLCTHFFLNPLLASHSKGGPGVGTIYIVAYILLFVGLVVAFIVKSIAIKT